MKNLMKHIGLLLVAMVAYTGSAFAQFDDVYFDPSKDMYTASNTDLAQTPARTTNARSSQNQSYNYTQDNDRPRTDDGQYAYDDDQYDYYNDDYQSGNYYFDDYAYTRRLNSFHRDRFCYDPFMYDDYYMMSSMYNRSRFYNPYRYSGFVSPFYRPGLSFGLGFGSPFGFNSYFGSRYLMGYGYGNMYGRFYNPYQYGFYDPIMAYNSYGYGYGSGYGGMYGSRYPYVYRNNVNPNERQVYYNGARRSGAGMVPNAREGRVQVRSSGNTDRYVQPTTTSSPRSQDRSNRSAGSVRSDQGQQVSPRNSGNSNAKSSPRSNTYTPQSRSTTNRVYRTPSKVETRPSGDRSTYTPRSSSRTRAYTPSNDSPRKTYTPSGSSSNQTRRTYTPSSRNSGRDYTPSSRNRGSSINRSAPSQRSYTPSSRSSGSSSSSSRGTSSSSSSRRSSPR